MASTTLCEADPRMSPNVHNGSSFAENKVSQCSFSIDYILGLDKKRDFPPTSIRPHRPWVDQSNKKGEIEKLFWRIPVIAYDIPMQIHAVHHSLERETTVSYDQCCSSAVERLTYKRELNWYRGRRQRTAFTRSQIEMLENVFSVNSYPGIDVREELANKLALDEDRIQIWFQNRRAKLKRSHRESQFLMVKDSLTPQIHN